MREKISVKNILILQGVVVIYTLSSVVAKFATGQELFSFSFFVFYGLEILILGIYAILWQQMIKRFDLSVAYANRAMALLWSAIWAIVLFHDTLALKQILGIAFVVLGTVIVNSDQKQEADDTTEGEGK
ncbi:MAG: transporter [Lachnospiraceae bacterium]|nr:transporter [Lachnospiraceae bacterium]